MGSKGSKKVKVPPPVPQPVMPSGGDPSVMRAAEQERRKMLARLGREGTILAGLGGKRQTLGLLGA